MIPVATLLTLRDYTNDQRTFYANSQSLVGMLQTRGTPEQFMNMLKLIGVEGKPFMDAVSEMYGITSVEQLQKEFVKYASPDRR